MGLVRGIAATIILLVTVASACAFAAAVVYFVRAPGCRRGSLLCCAAGILLTCVAGVWAIVDRDHRAFLMLAAVCVGVGSLEAGWRLAVRDAGTESGAPDQEDT